jgi:beta-phosphoglucomutase
MNKLFDAVADGNIVRNAKPDPEVFITAARMLGVPCENCIVFEDAAAGIEAAHNAGMICVGIGSVKVLKKADAVVSGLDKMNLKRLMKIKKTS